MPTEMRWARHNDFRLSVELVAEDRVVGWFADYLVAKKTVNSKRSEGTVNMKKEKEEEKLKSVLVSLFGEDALSAAVDVVSLWRPHLLLLRRGDGGDLTAEDLGPGDGTAEW